MLHWELFFIFSLLIIFWAFVTSINSIFEMLLLGEFIIIIFFCLFSAIGVFFNINLLIVIAYLFLLLGGLELALNILLLILIVKKKKYEKIFITLYERN